MTAGGLSSKRLARVRDLLARQVDVGYAPGAVVILARHGDAGESTSTVATRERRV